ncbi:LuxR C-terminal-related transcriptional regulator [Actinophytocola glycyrrhizae]|uniref:LuxR C-terminal-related transcriptional regulator n=1 Tax=Actinophytocola glycyrrhizae TaxID=2044873 RepID=A0ABV9SC84_9PSEU
MTVGTFPANLVPRPPGDLPRGSITVLLATDLGLLRGALVSMLSRHGDIEVVAALECGDEVVPTALRKRPDVVVIEVGVSSSGSLAAIGELRERLPTCQVVALAAAKPAGLVRRLLATDVLGAIDKNAPSARLLDAIRGAAAGQLVVDSSLAVAALTAEANPLTPREVDVVRLAAEGRSGPEIAKRLYLSPGTVRNYLSNVIGKTRGRTRTDAIRIARESGWA